MMLAAISLAQENDFEIDNLYFRPNACCVRAADVISPVEPKVMEVLVLLARAKGENVTRDQLVDACWESRVVSDDAITRTLSKARKIGALTDPPAFRIETRARIGVRLIPFAPASEISKSKALEARKTSEPLLLVFPFENLSTDADLQFFSDGVSEEVLGRIIRGSKLKVVGRSSSFQFRGEQKVGAAQALNATHTVDGSVRRAGNRVRINAHVTDVGTGAGIWADQFEGDLGDIFALQDEIAEGIARALFAKFKLASLNPIDPATYDLYLRAKDMETVKERQAASIASLERVTEVAPEFADGWGRLATLRALRRLNTPHQERKAITALLHHEIARCHALDPQNQQANYANFWLTAPLGHFLEQERIVQNALNGPNQLSDDLSMASFHCLNVGRMRQAHAFVLKARSFDPSSWAVSINYAIALWSVGNKEACLTAAKQHVETWPHDQQGTAYLLVLAMWFEDWAEIDRLTDPTRLEQFPLREHSGVLLTAGAMRSPTPDNKKFLFDMILARAQKVGAVDCSIFTIMSLAGMTQQSYDELAHFRIGPSGANSDALGMMGYRSYLLFAPANKLGRDDPRFVTMCARLGLVDYWIETGLWPDCADEVPYDFRAACKAVQGVVREVFEIA